MTNILFLYNYTDFAPQPWADAGFRCWCVDIKHPTLTTYNAERTIIRLNADLHDEVNLRALFEDIKPRFVVAFPVCTELSFIGTRHWKNKEQQDRAFLVKAAAPAILISQLCDQDNIPYMIENPRGALSWIWREADYTFDPCDYGGYLPVDDENPLAPNILAARDAYRKTTLIWTSKTFVMPEPKPVPPIGFQSAQGQRIAAQFDQLGGKSERTKLIRSASPRGFMRAMFQANRFLVEQ